MELISEPLYTETHVRDLEVAYLGGEVFGLTLQDADTFVMTDTTLHIQTESPKEMTTCLLRNILYWRVRPRTIRTPLAAPPQ
jgi:hypothetical protein